MATRAEVQALLDALDRPDLKRFIIGEVSVYSPKGKQPQLLGDYRIETHPTGSVSVVYEGERPLTDPVSGGEELSFHHRTRVRIWRVSRPGGGATYICDEYYSNPNFDDQDAGGLSTRNCGRHMTEAEAVEYVRTCRDERQIIRPPLRGRVLDARCAAARRRPPVEAPDPPTLVVLTSWADIINELNQAHDAKPWRNDETTRALIRKWNDEFDGTIQFGGKGSQPTVSRDGLHALIARVEEHFDKTTTERQQRVMDTAETTADTYRHGKAAVVVPDINGHLVNRRGTSEKVG